MNDNNYIGWSLSNWESLKMGGVWGVPRSGLMFTKTAQGFNLYAIVPMVPIAEQRSDFACIARYSGKAGLEVTDNLNLLGLRKEVK